MNTKAALAIGGVFLGCCSNVVFLELLVKWVQTHLSMLSIVIVMLSFHFLNLQSRPRIWQFDYVSSIPLHCCSWIYFHREVWHSKGTNWLQGLSHSRGNVLHFECVQQLCFRLQYPNAASHDIQSRLADCQHDHGNHHSQETIRLLEISVRVHDFARYCDLHDRVRNQSREHASKSSRGKSSDSFLLVDVGNYSAHSCLIHLGPNGNLSRSAVQTLWKIPRRSSLLHASVAAAIFPHAVQQH